MKNYQFKIKDDCHYTGYNTDIVNFEPKDSPGGGSITVSLWPSSATWEFNASGYEFGYNSGSTYENYVQWIAQKCATFSWVPDSFAVEPGTKFETPENGTFKCCIWHDVEWCDEDDILGNEKRSNYWVVEW